MSIKLSAAAPSWSPSKLNGAAKAWSPSTALAAAAKKESEGAAPGAKPSGLNGGAKPFSPMSLGGATGRPSSLTASAAPFVPKASTPGSLDPSAKAFKPAALSRPGGPGSANATPTSQFFPRSSTAPDAATTSSPAQPAADASAAAAFPTSPDAPPAKSPQPTLRTAAAPWQSKSRQTSPPADALPPADDAAPPTPEKKDTAPATTSPQKALWRPRGHAAAPAKDEDAKDEDAKKDEKNDDADTEKKEDAAPAPAPVATPLSSCKKVTTLANSWTLWYRPAAAPNANGDWQSNLKSIITFSDVETFWRVYNSIKAPSALAKGATYYLFRKGVEPAWEDPTCAEGGEWKVWLSSGKRADTDTLWVMFTLQCIGEQFLQSADVCGIAVETRSKADRVCVWTSTTEKTRTMALGRELKRALRGYIPQDQPLCFTSVKRSLGGGDKEVDYCIAD